LADARSASRASNPRTVSSAPASRPISASRTPLSSRRPEAVTPGQQSELRRLARTFRDLGDRCLVRELQHGDHAGDVVGKMTCALARIDLR
jgi:hypothetical protein